jgi:cytochrome c biogenesis protein CcmG, thiol:disulfide interchange protein DsbE
MAEKLKQERTEAKNEQVLAREQRQELKSELAENFAKQPRLPGNRRKTITFSVLGVIALLAIIFGILVTLPAAPQQPHGGVAVGAASPNFVLQVSGGQGHGAVDLQALRGQPVVINFWSESCQPCLAEVPYLRDTYAQYGTHGAFALVGVDQDDPRSDIAGFGQRYQVNYPLLFDPGSAVNIAYGVTSLPMTYFIDKNGIVRFVVPQQLTTQAMQQGLAAIGVKIP